MRQIQFSLCAIACLAFVASIPLTANADHSWGGYHWKRGNNPLQLSIGDNVNGSWDAHFDTAIADWNKSSVLNLTDVPGQSSGNCKATSGRVEVCNKAYGYNGWLGIAQIWIADGEHITQGIAKMNDSYFDLATYNTPEWRQMVMCQEIAHDFGLDHQDEDFNNLNLGTCMDYTSDPSSNQHPNTHDFAELGIIYSHLDDADNGGSGGNCNPKSPKCNSGNAPGNNGANARELHSQADWGQLVREQGRNAIYERDFGNGNKVVTFVIWAY